MSFSSETSWTVQKSGWYYVADSMNAEYKESGGVFTKLLINDTFIGRYFMCNWNWNNSVESYSTAQTSIYLNQNDTINFSYELGATFTQSWCEIYIYAMFE